MKIECRLIDVPDILIPRKWQLEHQIKLLEINGKTPALQGLYELRRKSEQDYKKLLKISDSSYP